MPVRLVFARRPLPRPAFSLLFSFVGIVPAACRRVHPRRGHRCNRRQSNRRKRCTRLQRQAMASAVSTADGSFQILTGIEGRFFLLVSAKSFRQLQTPISTPATWTLRAQPGP